MVQPFALFNFDHLMAVLVVLIVALGPPIILRQLKNQHLNDRFAYVLGWFLLFYGIFKHLYGPIGLGEAWQIWLPLHMCQISNFIIAYLLISGKRGRAVDVVYFWTFAGATMALVTPDLKYGWPDPNYILYMITHGVLLLGMLYFTIVEGLRPQVASIWRVLKVSVLLMLVIIPLNYLIGGEANYWYLRAPPVVGSLMDFLPAPPLHIPFLVALAYVFFWLVYLPYYFKDMVLNRFSVESSEG